MSLQYRELKLQNLKVNDKDNLKTLQNILSQMERGVTLVITIQVEGSKLKKLKALYFSMVSELAKYAGNMSRKEQEQFKEQVKDQLQIDSIANITDEQDILIIIESLHQLASEHYNYIFKPNDPEIFTFNFGKRNND